MKAKPLGRISQSPEMSQDLVLSVQGVSKKFCRNLKRSMLYGMRDLANNMLGRWPQGALSALPDGLRKDEFWALRDVSLDLRRGEALGVIGHNGCGKTTLLRLLTGIFPPDQGTIAIRGRIGALIALGAGFHPHMSGRENIYLNGAILGMSKGEIAEKYNKIVEFAGVGKFLEAPVSTYSSGMSARLGFSIAIHTSPDLLLVDEVLSVGDMAFQAKCSERMHDYARQGGAVIFVSHNMNAVQGLCSRVLWMKQGKYHMEGESSRVISSYLEETDAESYRMTIGELQAANKGSGDFRIIKTVLRNEEDVETSCFFPGEKITVEIHYETTKKIMRPYFLLGVGGRSGSLFAANMLFDNARPESIEGSGLIRCKLDNPPLLPQLYWVRGGVRASDGISFLIESRTLAAFTVSGTINTFGFSGKVAESLTRDSAPVLVPYEWILPDGSRYKQDFLGLKSNRCKTTPSEEI
jgi:lipopolysaccharide transport system ATP-binding protein